MTIKPNLQKIFKEILKQILNTEKQDKCNHENLGKKKIPPDHYMTK
jgi:hypothetical protein